MNQNNIIQNMQVSICTIAPEKPREFREISASFLFKTRGIHVNSAGFAWWDASNFKLAAWEV